MAEDWSPFANRPTREERMAAVHRRLFGFDPEPEPEEKADESWLRGGHR
jgi:hypothetical protein